MKEVSENNICLLSVSASHYRYAIYKEIQQLGCDFILGVNRSTVKRMDTSLIGGNVLDVRNKYLGKTNIYYQVGVIKKTRKYKIIINDLGILSITAWFLLIIARFRGQRVYNWDHGYYGKEGRLKKLLKSIYFGLAEGALLYGNYARDLMIKEGFDGRKLHVIHNSLNYEAHVSLREQIKETPIYSQHFNNTDPNLIFVGRLTSVKKLDMILEAMALNKEKGRNYNLTLIGGGEVQELLEKNTNRLGLKDNVWFYGPCYDEKVLSELIYNADLCVSPGNVGLTAIHSLVFGTPVLTHNNFTLQMPEFESVKEGVTGTFFEHNNVRSLSEAIDIWFDSHKDDREFVRERCYAEIDESWTPQYQINVIKKALGYV